MDPTQQALRPLTLPSLSPELSRLSHLKAELASAEHEIEGYQKVQSKLETFTDEPTWNAFIPFGPLAYFSGQLIHTNDVTRVTSPPADEAGKQEGEPQRVLRSAKQAREDAKQAVKDLEAKVLSLTQEIEDAEADLRKKREDERKAGEGARAATADMGDEDWTINAQGEVINEEGLPMFDIREDLPAEPAPAASTSIAQPEQPASSSAGPKRYLIKKGGKQVVRPLAPPSSAPAPSTSTPTASSASSSTPAAIRAPAIDPNPFPVRPVLDVKAILDELEAEEAADAAAVAAAAPPLDDVADEVEETQDGTTAKIVELPSSPPAETPAPAPAPAPAPSKPARSASGGFGGFSAGFLAKSKQKRPSNSLAPASSASKPAFPAPAACPSPAAAGLKPALSRPASPSRAATPAAEKKRVAFDLPSEDAGSGASTPKRAPIILGPPDAPPVKNKEEKKKEETPVQRPVRDVVIERPLRKPVPPSAALAGGMPVREKRLSRFKREAFGAPAVPVTEQKEVGEKPEGKGKARAEPAPPAAAPAVVERTPTSAATAKEEEDAQAAMPAPVHTISLSARPSGPDQAEGTVSFGDIPYESDESGSDHLPEDGDDEEDGEDWTYSDEDDDFDDEELDVDLALHQREVALAYHRQRLALGAGRGTGPLGGFHNEGENPFGAAAGEADRSLVPADATLQSLDPSLASSTFGTYADAGAAQEGRPSRFRLANRNLESAQLIIPSLLAADPALSMSHTPLGPPLAGDADEGAAEGLGDEQEERLRRTLEALAEGRPLPEDEEAAEREREVLLREELAREKELRRDRTAGRRPPQVLQTLVPERKAPAPAPKPPGAAEPPAGAAAQGEEQQPKKLSRTWQQRSFEFASYLFLVQLFPNTTLQPSIYGFCTTGAAIVLSGSVGHLVDEFNRVRFVRGTIIAQKGTIAISYAIFFACFLELYTAAKERREQPTLIGLFAVLTLFSMAQNLATIGISVAVERDWVTCIAQGDSAKLTRLNTYLRRIDLLSKLLAPLFVSLLTTAASYTFASALLLGLAVGATVFEFAWINLVYRRFPMLAESSSTALPPPTVDEPVERPPIDRPSWTASLRAKVQQLPGRFRLRIVAEGRDWLAFVRAPVFFSSLAISLLYLTVLSFEGSMLAYLKSHSYDDAFVAGMRGIGVVTGLMGTMVMPLLEKRIGLVRAGTWSIFSEVVTLIPAVLAFFVGAPPDGKRGPTWNDALLFAGMAVSRIGLWSFDLCQLKELQEALNDHPRRNSIMALQFSLQNIFDLVKYAVTIVLHRPSQFKWAVVISFASVCCGALSYLVYARKERGHLVHLEWTEALLRKTR
ncbi:hypothetical protein JCM10449v2_002783 [Rhodotorula kratochvilovae]